MSYLKILDVNVNFLRVAAKKDFSAELDLEIESKLASLDDVEGLPYDKRDIIQLISSIETDKVRFVKGEISAKRLYCAVDYSLSRFKIKHPEFDHLKDPAMSIYFS
ncbi:MAG TPA: hypothetical protein VN365_02930 [Candidatus Thermoplasmatota archaeon]|jgi:hypothetical protein|nr:hypothetical protein [Syntrophaceae bacterium]HWR63340.1 hypothetical protein [Candidatus Thermoplasmatota archaeon]